MHTGCMWLTMFPPCCRGSSGNGGWHVDAFECLLCLYFVLCRCVSSASFVFRCGQHLSSFALHPAVPSGEGLQLGCTTAKGTRTDSSLYYKLESVLVQVYYCLPFYINGI